MREQDVPIRITCVQLGGGRWAPIPGKSGRKKVYPAQRLAELVREMQQQYEPRPDPDRPGAWRVPVVSRLHAGMEAIVDEESLPLVRGWRWNWSPGNRPGEGTVVVAMRGTPRPPLHQIVMGVSGPQYRVGHLNSDPLDCRRENLVVRNASEQKAATRKVILRRGKTCASPYKGVTRTGVNARWSAAITAYGQHRPLGRFASEIGAALAYDAAARETFGEHAVLNFADPDEAARMRVLADQAETAAPAPWPPEGMIDRREACRMFGVAYETWQHWENAGKVPKGQSGPKPLGNAGRCMVYPVAEMQRLLEAFNQVGQPYADRPGCVRVPLRSLIHQMEAIIDAAALPHVQGKHWNWSPRNGAADGRVTLATTGKQLPLSRIIAGVTDAAMKVSHTNRDPLDCRRENLVIRTMAEQAPGNRKMGTVSGRKYTSNYKGVSWDEPRGKWKAQIGKNGANRCIGRFDDEIAAAEAYDEAALELFGEHAYLNFPNGIDAAMEAESRKAA